MTARKRKQPEKKKKVQRSAGLVMASLAMRGLSNAGSLAARNPGVFGGSMAFAVVFSFVAANALWYQPGAHPSPLLRTRLPFTHPQAANLGVEDEQTGIEPRKVTTFVIQREDEAAAAADAAKTEAGAETASIVKPKLEPSQSIEDVIASQSDVASQPVEKPAGGSAVVMNIQKELARRGLYDGTPDGKTGPKTSAAILRFEKQTDRAETGAATDELLAALRQEKGKQQSAALPASRPYENIKASKGELDPVAAAIRNAEIDPQYIPKADIPASSELVMNIQKGLTNLAYTDVSIDGVAGEQTRTAIRHFEKHYRLPETGQPSDKVLKKMKEIGAL